MGRIPIKGGVWNNTEDEILKASVMKHAKNDWARISSLLPRKSAKQCKARWYEWLDPSIRKTEWTRQEDEKLLHLAKLMPTQWRTIAPIVGRTPSQCLERYKKLLYSACFVDENYEPGDDPRKLRPGEIDPNPESKPARPDSVDMDEYEKEILSEARARLANTKGKKAKRKGREKLLEEAWRLATLQKKRELIAAGIVVDRRKRNLRGIDYNLEIPFEERPPPGFFDVAEEEEEEGSVIPPKFPTTIEEIEGKRRIDLEALLRRQDIAKNKTAQRQAILQANKFKELETVRKRSKLMLPPPQIREQELEEIARMRYVHLIAGREELTGGSGATRGLLENLAQTPFRTSQRTPVGEADAIMMEAKNLARLRDSQTPLLGGVNPESQLSDFSGVAPMKREMQTPNPRSAIGDRFQRKEVMHKGSKLESRRNLRSSLGNLPHPQHGYEITIQQHPEDNDDEEAGVQIEEDMSCTVAREKAEEEARKQALLKKRSEELLRQLPRPPTASVELVRNSLKTSGEQADNKIQQELLSLSEHENAVKEKTKKRKYTTSVHEIEEFDEYELREADSDIQEEVARLGVAMEHINESLDVASNAERLDALRDQFEDVKSRMGDETEKAQRLEQKLKLLTHGYQKRAADLLSQIEVAYNKIHTAAIDLECFQDLQKQENLAASNRVHGLLGEIRKQKVLQEVLQKRYGNILAEQERIQQPGTSFIRRVSASHPDFYLTS